MSRELLILRHAKSAWDSDAESDFDRPLNKRGRHDAPRVGRWLAERARRPDCLVASEARRARQTAHRVADALGEPRAAVDLQRRIYLAQRETLLAVLADCPAEARRVLLVGHNPGLDDLLTWLVDGPLPTTESGKLLTTATVARLRLPDDWSALTAGCAEFVELVRPSDLDGGRSGNR